MQLFRVERDLGALVAQVRGGFGHLGGRCVRETDNFTTSAFEHEMEGVCSFVDVAPHDEFAIHQKSQSRIVAHSSILPESNQGFTSSAPAKRTSRQFELSRAEVSLIGSTRCTGPIRRPGLLAMSIDCPEAGPGDREHKAMVVIVDQLDGDYWCATLEHD